MMTPSLKLLMNHISTFLHASEVQLATAIPAIRSSILLLASAAIGVVATIIVIKRFPDFGFRVRGFIRSIRMQITSPRFQAPLTDVACQICRRGTAVFDPIYIDYKGHPHIEGNCNCCGAYIRVRLQ